MESFAEYVVNALEEAKRKVWSRIQSGHFDGPNQAKATFKVYEHLQKAKDIAEEHLSQMEMPIQD